MKMFANLPKQKLQQVILVGILTVAGVGLAIYLYVGPQLKAMGTAKKRVAEITRELEETESNLKREAQNKHLREQTEAFIKAQHAAMVSGDPFSWVVREVHLLAEKHPVRVLSLRPGSSSRHNRVSRFEVFMTQIEVAGDYDQIGNFVKDLENRFPTGEVRTLEIAGDGTARAELRASLQVALLMNPDRELAEAKAGSGS